MNKKQKNKDMEQEDVVYEEEGVGVTDVIKKLRERIKKIEKESKENLDGWQRAKADFQNFKNSLDKDRESIIKLVKENTLNEILPVIDSFEMAFANKKAWNNVNSDWRIGVEYIYSQLKTILETNGITEIQALRELFDPVKHSSTEIKVVNDEKDDGRVVEVVQKGYMINGKVLRPAKVKVGEYKKS